MTDNVTGDTATASTFTGGLAGSDGSIFFAGIGHYISAPKGSYIIVDNPNPKPGSEDWFGIFRQDDRIDDYFDEGGKQRCGIRLHLGGTSEGCITVNIRQKGAEKKWKNIRRVLNNTSSSNINFRKGPHWWNGTGQTTRYGTLTIK